MEKYRRWTDQTAGVNPFVVANTQSSSLVEKILSVVAIVIKGSLFVAYLPVFVVLSLIPITFIRQNAAAVLLLFLGVYAKEDFSLGKADKNGKISIVLSNHTCFIDPIYYIYRFPGCQFLVFHEDQNGKVSYSTLSSLGAFFSTFTSLQFFYKNGSSTYTSLKSLVNESSYIKNGGKLIIFYEKIRTNGRGTIRIDKNFADDIYELEKDIITAQIKYTSKKDKLFSLTTSGLSVLLAALGTVAPGNNIKLRAIKQDHKDTHSANELRQGVNSMAVGALLQTKPKSYFQFLEFYQKTQKDGYKLEE